MTNKYLNTNFRVKIKIENLMDGTECAWVFEYGKLAVGPKKLKKAVSDCFNTAHKFIREDIELKHENKGEGELLIS